MSRVTQQQATKKRVPSVRPTPRPPPAPVPAPVVYETVAQVVNATEELLKRFSKSDKWRTEVGQIEQEFMGNVRELTITGDPKHLFDFLKSVPIRSTDYNYKRNVMHMAAILGEPEIAKLLIRYGAKPTGVDAYGEHPIHFVAKGRVSAEKVEEFTKIYRDWDVSGFNNVVKNEEARELLLKDALTSENYAFYELILQRFAPERMYRNKLAFMKEPHSLADEATGSQVEERAKNVYGYDSQDATQDYKISLVDIPSLTNICMSVVKMKALTSPPFRNQMKTVLPPEVIQKFIDCLPNDQYSFRLLEFFKAVPGVSVDVKKYYWSIYEFELHHTSRRRGLKPYSRFCKIYSVYDNVAKFEHPPKDAYDDPTVVKRIFENRRPYSGKSVVTLPTFQNRFEKFTDKFFEGYDWSKTVVIGSTVLANLIPHASKHDVEYFKNADIDVCFYNLSTEEFREKAFNFISYCRSKLGNMVVLSTDECITICANAPNRRIQIMKGSWASIENIILNVDVDCTGFAYDGTKVWATPRAILAINRCWSVPTTNHSRIRGSSSYEERLIKYAYRGFTIVDFNMPPEEKWKAQFEKHLNHYSNYKLQPCQSYHGCQGALLVLLVEALAKSGKVDYDVWERRDYEKELPAVSKAWPPGRILKEILAGKYVYHSYGEKITAYKSKFTPVSEKYLADHKRQYLTPSDLEETRHWVSEFHSGLD